MFFAANGARFGFQKTVSANLGYHVATWLMTIGIGLGFGYLINLFPSFFIWIKYAGSLYVLYLAWTLIRAGAFEGESQPRVASFWDGAVLLVLNPKAYVIIALIYSQFSDPDSSQPFVLVLAISTIFTLNNFIAFSVWTFVGEKLGALFRKDASARRLNLTFGFVLALVAIVNAGVKTHHWPE